MIEQLSKGRNGKKGRKKYFLTIIILCLSMIAGSTGLMASSVEPQTPVRGPAGPMGIEIQALNPSFEHLGQEEVTYVPGDVAVFKNRLYVTSIDMDLVQGAFDIIDVSNPEDPWTVGTSLDPLLKFPVAVFVNPLGNRAYISDCYAAPGHHSYVHIMEIDTPSQPQLHVSGQSPGNAVDVFYSNGFIYEAAFHGGLAVHEPSHADMMGYCTTYDIAAGLYVVGQYAYVAEMYMGTGGQVTIVDVTDPFYPQVVSMCKTNGSGPKGIHVVCHSQTPSGHQQLYAYIADTDGLQIMDVSDPLDPFRVVHIDVPGNRCLGVFARKDYAFVTAGEEGIYLIDIHDPEAPFIAAHHKGEIGSAERITVSGSYVYVTDCNTDPSDMGNGSVHVLKLVFS